MLLESLVIQPLLERKSEQNKETSEKKNVFSFQVFFMLLLPHNVYKTRRWQAKSRCSPWGRLLGCLQLQDAQNHPRSLTFRAVFSVQEKAEGLEANSSYLR